MTQTPPDMKIRFSSDLRALVEASARANNRTMNAEIVSRLEQSYRDDAAGDARSKTAARNLLRSGMGDDLEKRVEELERRLDALEAKA